VRGTEIGNEKKMKNREGNILNQECEKVWKSEINKKMRCKNRRLRHVRKEIASLVLMFLGRDQSETFSFP